MGFQELKREFEKLTPADVGKTKQDQQYRYWLLKLLFEIHGDMDSLAYCYREMLKIQQERQTKR